MSHRTIGARLGAYRIDALLGAGGMGEVYRAHDERLGRDVAVKVLPKDLPDDVERLARFDREARTLGYLRFLDALYLVERQNRGCFIMQRSVQ
jgi:serine/threonine protein kinase